MCGAQVIAHLSYLRIPDSPPPTALVRRGHRCRFRRARSRRPLRGLQYSRRTFHRTALMRTRHDQAATHGGRFRSRYESQAAAQRLRRHRAQNQRRGSVEQQDACATTTASNSLTFISKVSRAGDRRVRQAAIELWGTPGPPDHLSNSICREVAQWLKKNGQAADISDATILRAVGRK